MTTEQSALSKKLKLKTGAHAAVIAAPAGYLDELEPLPANATITTKLGETHDWIQVFCATKADLDTLAPKAAAALAPVSLLWLCFPKGSSKLQTDLTRDIGWDVLEQLGLKWVTLVSVNDTWSAFGLRPHRPGEERQTAWFPRP